jgi:head-tail adaptor
MMACTACKEIPRYMRTLTVERLKAGLTPDASGHVDKTSAANWVQAGRLRGNFKSIGTREFIIGDQVQSQLSHTVTSPWTLRSAGYTDEYRLRMGSRIFNINGPPQNTDEMNRELVFTVVEVPAS